MSKVVRLSDIDLEIIENYRKIKIEQMKVLDEEFPYIQEQILEFKNKEVKDLLKDMLSSAVYWNEKNLNDMRGSE